MDTNQNRLNLFISIDTIKTFMDKHADNQEPELQKLFADCAYTVDITDAAQRLFYRASPDQIELELDWRGLIYQAEESETHRQAVLTLDQQGNVQGNAPDELQNVMQIFLFFCLNMSLWLSEHGVFEKYTDLNPKQQGILVEEQGNELVLNPVSGDERPDLVCRTLSGEMKLMRPYEADMMREVLLDAMPIEKKEAAAEGGDVRMMKHLFQYYMGDYTSAHKDLERNARAMMKLMRAASGEGEEIHEEEEEDTRNPEKAFYWLKKLAESGDTGAMNTLGDFYMKAFGTERDFERAAEWKAKAVENGAEEEDSLGQVLLSAAEMKAKAEAGDTEGQANYARILALFAQYRTDLGDKADEEEAFRWAQKSASKSDPDGIFTLASFYENGTGTAKDATKAFRLFERAANKGHVPSQARLGQMYFQGNGTQENPQAAYEWSRKAAEAGDMNGMSNLAACYLLGKGVEQNAGKAVEWLQKAASLGDEGAKGLLEKLGAPLKPQQEEESQPQTVEEAEQMAEQGSVKAMKLLINYYINRPGGKDDLYEAHKWAKKAADLGDEEAKQICANLEATFNGETISFEDAKRGAENGNPGLQKILADYYATGYKTERDLVKALYWMKKAAASGDQRFAEHAQGFVDNFSDIEEVIKQADEGNPRAQAQLAEKYVGISQNYTEYNQENGQRDAFKMAGKSASAGDPRGMYVLGICYENGYGTEVDFDKAFDLYKKSAELADPRGELSLSQVYLLGRGTETDPDAAVAWLEKAEQHGNPEAEQARTMYPQIMFGMGLDKMGDGANSGGSNPELGARLVKKAAELGHGAAQGALGMLYLNGNNVKQDFEAGIGWLRKAADNGNAQSAQALKQLERPEAYFAAANKEFSEKENADKEKVFRLMKHAAEGGLAVAQDNLGFMYMNGYGVQVDYTAGMEWFRKAAEQGNESALRNIRKYESADGMFMTALAEFTLKRKAGMTDCQNAYELLKKAAESGSPEAMNLLGVFFADPTELAAKFGLALEADPERARSLFEKALQTKPDLKQAENNLKKLEDLKAAKEAGREPDRELKWAVALKKPTSGSQEDTKPVSEEAPAETPEQGAGAAATAEHTPEKPEEMSQDVLCRQYQANGKCRYCGGDFRKGLFSTKCLRCGKKKDY
ncbi:MAG: sel1 repeat family protein [Oscillospiraceae bacterium]|nr:sel1 repeat family protein [Oscillospiraceae bacterium]